MAKSKLFERLEYALQADPGILANKDDIGNHSGRTTEYMVMLGITKGDLIRLERAGLAVRGYTFNGRGLIEKDGKQYKEFGNGRRLMWIIYAPMEVKDDSSTKA